MSLLICALTFVAQPRDLSRDFARIAHTIDGQVGAAAQVLENGDPVSYNGPKRFATQSVYKVPISMTVLSDVEKGKLSLEQKIAVKSTDLVPEIHSPLRDANPHGTVITVRELIQYAIVESDGTASDVLMKLVGGASAVTRYLRSIGVKDFTAARTEREQIAGPDIQYENWLTPLGGLELLRQLQIGLCLTPPNRELILRLMRETQTAPNRIRGLLPPGTEVAHKSGTSGTDHGLARTTNDIGIVTLPDGRHLMIAVLVRDSHASEKQRDLVIAKIARAAWDASTP